MPEHRNSVMIIDDDVNLMNAMTLVLKKYGINLVTYTEPIAALQELNTNSESYDVLVTNYIFQGVNGDEIIRKIRQDNKDLYIILMSSHKELAPSIDIMRSLDIQAFFEKGSNFDDLILLIESGYRSVSQINSIKQMSSKIDNFGIEFATAIRNMIGARDKYTEEHSSRVSIYAVMLAKELQLPSNDVKLIDLAANFHDIGKIGVSDTILLKPGKLTDEEYAAIKLHPVIGENILSTSETFKDCLPIIRHHHERIDGNGYPDKLKGEAIPYLARLLAVCDTFDAITSKRIYRDKSDIDEATQELIRVKGSQLDEIIVDAFVQITKRDAIEIEKVICKFN